MQQIAETIRSARTFPSFIRAVAQEYGEAVAIRLEDNGKTITALTYSELERQSHEMARGLLAHGIGKGTRVGFIMGNGPQFAVVFAAIARIGAVAIPVSTLVRADELVRVLRQSDVSGLIVQRKLLGHDLVERLCEALPALRDGNDAELRLDRTPYLRWIASSGNDLPSTIKQMEFLTERAGSVDSRMLLEVEAEVHTADQMVEIYTSGSMAQPKGVRHDHGPVLARVDYIRSMSRIAHGADRAMYQPMFWVGGLFFALLPTLAAGAVHVCSERTPTSSLMAMGSVLADDELKLLDHGGPHWAMGMTETVGPYAWSKVLRIPGYPLSSPMDHIAEGFEVRIADAQGNRVADGEAGEIQIRGYGLTRSLHKLERAEHFTPDGFYHTGDMGVRDGTRIHFIGRNGDMIKTAGSNVSPAEVEEEMQRLEPVHSAYVVGLPDPRLGQRVVAAVVARANSDIDFSIIEQMLRQRLSGYKVPKQFVQIRRDEVPMLSSNKVARRQIEALVAERLGSPSAPAAV